MRPSTSFPSDLLTHELEVAFLECLARDPDASPWMTVQRRDTELLAVLRRHLPTASIDLTAIHDAARNSPAITCREAPSDVIDGRLSRHTLLCNPRKLPGVTANATQADFVSLAEQLRRARHQAVAGLSSHQLTLKPDLDQPRWRGTLTLRNVGYGPQDAVQVLRVSCPPWLQTTTDGSRVTLESTAAFNGCYQGPVTIHTTAGQVTATITSPQWRCPPNPPDPVSWRELVTRHAHLDEAHVVPLVDAHLTAAGYRALTGGFFTQRRHGGAGAMSSHADPEPPTSLWVIDTYHLRQVRLPAAGHLPLVRLYAPDGSDRYDVTFDGKALHGEALAELLTIWDVRVGQEFRLTPYRGHYRFELDWGGNWLCADATRYQIVATSQALNRTQGFWDQLETWLISSPVQVLLHGDELGLLRDLLQRFPDHLQVRTTSHPPGESRVHFTVDSTVTTQGLPEGQALRDTHWPQHLWDQAHPLPTRERVAPTPTPRREAPPVTPTRPQAQSGLSPYEAFSGTVTPPLIGTSAAVLQSVKAILQVEGPMVGHHLYVRYAAAPQTGRDRAPVTPMQLKRVLNPLLHGAVKRGELLAEDEFGVGGQIGLVYRLPGQETRPRQHGDRALDRIPLSELRAVIDTRPSRQALLDELEQVAWILEQFGFGRFVEGGLERIRPLIRSQSQAAGGSSQRRRIR